ncbi:MAG TPA: alpha-E domain-containing protein [Nevskiaceae bacterium]|nr:alpha-E domain-containing protein [Nevskiaceae bacterium]
MLSRVADNLYWFGRYLQRAENTARLIMVNASLLLDLPKHATFGWGPLIEIVGAKETYAKLYPDATEANVVRFLVLDQNNPGSIFSSLHFAREILRTSRDIMPREIWEKLNDLYLFVQEKGDRVTSRARRQDFLTEVIESALLIYGMIVSNMSREVGFHFLRIGTNIEQADMTTRIIEVRSTTMIRAGSGDQLAPFLNIWWMSVLRSLTAYQMYRRHVRIRVSGPSVLRFLLQNRQFPRSVVFCLNTIASTLPNLPPNRKIERSIERTRALVQDADVEGLLATDAGLHRLIDEIQIGLGDLHDAMRAAWFKL